MPKTLHRANSPSFGCKPGQGAALVCRQGAFVLEGDEEVVELFPCLRRAYLCEEVG